MRVLVTGAGGFIGSHSTRALVEAGHDVAAVVRPGHGHDRLADVAERARVVEADLADRDRVGVVLDEAKPEAILHAAWYVEPGRYLHAAAENLAAVETTAGLLRAALDSGCGRVVLVGTGFEPGAGGAAGGVDPPQRSVYRSAKAAVHDLAAGLADEGASVTCAHVFYLYGPGEDANRLVPALIRACLAGEPIEVTDGRQRRDYLHVADVAAGLRSLVEHDSDPSVDVCSGAPLEVRELYDAVGAATGHRDLIHDGARPYGDGEVLKAAGDDAMLRSLGWVPSVSLADGIAECVAWWRSRS